MRHIRPRKGLGQAFLTHEPTADALVAGLDPGRADTVLEIGPGKGILTRRLLACAGRVIAVEIDERLVSGLRQELGGDSRLELVYGDFMTFDLSQYRGLKVMGNLPYNLSSQMVLRLLDSVMAWDRAVLTTQREFADRLLGQPGTKAYGALTVLFERLTERERLFTIMADRFKPRPDVVSTAFLMRRRDRPLFEVDDSEWFRCLVRTCFAQRRKTIANNIMSGLGLGREAVTAALERCGIDPGSRAETVAPVAFSRLARELSRPG